MKLLLKTLGYQFKDPLLLQMALTHRSMPGQNNERLEFLGDGLLNLVIAAALYKQFQFADEGELSRLRASLVNEAILADIAQDFDLGKYLRLGPGELKSGGARRKSILADALEAIIGAIYLDSDVMTCESIVLQWFNQRLQNMDKTDASKDAKSSLQEYLQSRKLGLPQYTVLSITGEPHAQRFHMACEVTEMDYRTEGVGTTRRAAEQMAAEAFLVWISKQKARKEIMITPPPRSTWCGYIAIIGRPNVGKSTLLNAFLGKKISITSRKPQTTRHRITGIKTIGDTQFVFVDTPGIHTEGKYLINRYLNRAAVSLLKSVDCILWVIDALHWNDDDTLVAEKLAKIKVPVLLVVNKIDELHRSDDIMPIVEKLSKKFPELEIIPVSAKKSFNLDTLEKCIRATLPEQNFLFGPEQLTDRSDYFMASEFIREKLVRLLGQELPYATMVAIESWEKKKEILHIGAIIWVEKESQKGIVIGKHGETLKKIGTQARIAMEKHFGEKIFLQLWVKVKDSWSEDERILRDVLA